MSQIKVTIIIPVFNVELYLSKCLDTVVNQTLKELEIICINDGSTDSSLSILKEYAAKDNRIIIIDKVNEGQGLARNIAIKQASGEYLGFVDSDDWIELDMFQKLYESAKQFSTDITLCELELFDPTNEKIYQPEWTKIPYDSKFDNRAFHWSEDLKNTFRINSGPVNKLYKTAFLKGLEAEFAIGLHFEDILFVFNCIFNAKIISYIRTPFYVSRFYRLGSTSSDKGIKQFDIFKIFELLEKAIENTGKFESIKPEFYKYRYSRYLFHFLEIEKKYKTEFWNQIKKEFDGLDNEIKQALFKHDFQLVLGMKYGLFYFNNFERILLLRNTFNTIFLSHNLQARFKTFIKKLKP